MKQRHRRLLRLGLVLLLFCAVAVIAAAQDGTEAAYQSNMYGTFWSLVPPVIAIVLALVTKEVYISLFVGIAAGALFYSNFRPWMTIESIVKGFIGSVAGADANFDDAGNFVEATLDGWNLGILMFLIVLGIMVALMNKAGGSAAYGRWAGERIKSKRGALLATSALGVLIFVDDYFNCLTVGSVMRPVTDKHKISRAKLSYIIDATAAPVCIIAPISSWAAAVTSSAADYDINGFTMFIRAIPFNFYALLTLAMLVAIAVMKFDFGPMKKHEQMAEQGDLFGGTGNEYLTGHEGEENPKGRVIDLILPVIVLIVTCVLCMIYTGGFFSGESFVDAFANCDASLGLALGSFISLLFTFLLYIPRRVLTFRQFADCIPDGFRQMVPAILILIFAWTLSGFVTGSLGADVFVKSILNPNSGWANLLPAAVFLIAMGIAFSTGTSWGTMGILVPIVLGVLGNNEEMLIVAISACLAGAVCGDHTSPISDTTIMASTGAQSNHIAHVSTQLPYALLVAAISLVGYLVAGFFPKWYVLLPLLAAVLVGILFILRRTGQKQRT